MKNIFLPFIITSCFSTFACTPSTYRIYEEHKHTENPDASATELLHLEFDTTRRVLQILENASNCLDNDKPVSKETFNEIIDVINGFTHKCILEKEDKVLFPFLKEVRGGEKKNFLGQLLMEHVSARDEIRNLSAAVNYIYQGKKAKKKIIKIARAYLKFMDKHIHTEEKVLFPWMNKVLTRDEQMILIKIFESMEEEDIVAGVHEKYTTMIERLEEQLGVCAE
ncbi:MAG TPA: hemerythrin domain-containing protein [Candidatus Brocadiaceae bacterium]|nr:hemerythrin domain-containing protein [Candidatus Brocadiaceae bacterium]